MTGETGLILAFVTFIFIGVPLLMPCMSDCAVTTSCINIVRLTQFGVIAVGLLASVIHGFQKKGGLKKDG